MTTEFSASRDVDRVPDGKSRANDRRERAFSLVEILIVMGLLTIIILGLMAMFNQTQRAFRLGMTQTDVLESGRIATDMLVRELEQITPSGLNRTNLNSGNFFAAVINPLPPFGTPPFATPATYYPELQPLPGGAYLRTNVLEDLFFVTRRNQTWTGIGYFVRSNSPYAGAWSSVGTLYRFETNASVMAFPYPANPQSSFLYTYKTAGLSGFAGAGTGVSKVLDGVVHFRVRAYDVSGNWINPGNSNVPPGCVSVPSLLSPTTDDVNYFFLSNAVPAFVEVEIGILEPHILDRYRSIPNPVMQSNFLYQQAGHVHLFRQRVAVRNVELGAYQ